MPPLGGALRRRAKLVFAKKNPGIARCRQDTNIIFSCCYYFARVLHFPLRLITAGESVPRLRALSWQPLRSAISRSLHIDQISKISMPLLISPDQVIPSVKIHFHSTIYFFIIYACCKSIAAMKSIWNAVYVYTPSARFFTE